MISTSIIKTFILNTPLSSQHIKKLQSNAYTVTTGIQRDTHTFNIQQQKCINQKIKQNKIFLPITFKYA